MNNVVLLIALPLSGCFLSPIPETKTAVAHAHALDVKCRGYADRGAASLLSPGAVDSVEPAISHVQSGPMDPEARLRGARIHVRPLAGLAKESLQRTLECHEAAVALGTTPPLEDDPYILPSQWLDIDVDSEGDGFVVSVRTDDIATARQVLERAKHYAAANRVAQPPPPSRAPSDAASPPSTSTGGASVSASVWVSANAQATLLVGSALQMD
jgi:hypothetical protein